MLTFSAVPESELPEVIDFLHRIFGTPAEHPPFREAVLRWKAIAPHPFWSGSRSYVYRKEGKIQAHGCVAPVDWLHAGGTTRAACVLDWAANRALAGIGVMLFRSVGKMVDGLMAVGGSEDTLRILPHAGFRQIVSMPLFARVVRPVSRNLGGRLDWKTPGRMARDVARALTPLPDPGPEWRATRVARFDAGIELALPTAGRPSPIVARRSPDLLNYWLDCPAAAMEGYRVSGPAGRCAYFVLSKLGGECRIADLGVSSSTATDWNAAVKLATRTAAEDRSVHTLKMGSSATLLQAALTAASFRVERTYPVLYWDSIKKGIEPGERSMTLAENDFFYLP